MSSELEARVLEIFRRVALRGDPRPLDLEAPLGELGIGLDSLALTQFVVALENELELEVEDTIWTDKGRLSLRSFVELAVREETQDATAAGRTVPAPPRDPGSGPAPSRRTLPQLLRVILRRYVYHHQHFAILSKDLRRPWPAREPLADLTLRALTLEDVTRIESTDPSWISARRRRRFRDRLSGNYLGLGAWRGDELVGVDWLAFGDDADPDTRLVMRPGPGICYALDLFEKYPGEGIGIALLHASLGLARDRGCHTQVTYVLTSNLKMLGASIQFFGFEKVGTIETRRFGRLPVSRWSLAGRSGRGGVVALAGG